MLAFTDTHAHLYSEQFETDIDGVIERAFESGTKRMIIPATSHEDHSKVLELCKKYHQNLYAAYGLHPTDIDQTTDIEFEMVKIEERIAEGGVVAIGECGLDLYWSTEHIEKQKIALRRQFEISIKNNLPLILHTRDAFEPMFELLEEFKGRLRGVMHGFNGTIEQAHRVMELGDFVFGIGGVVTFKNSTLWQVVEQLPLSKIVLETDAPYLTPTPFRGKRNEPSYIPLIAARIAEVKGISKEEISEETEKNSSKLFDI